MGCQGMWDIQTGCIEPRVVPRPLCFWILLNGTTRLRGMTVPPASRIQVRTPSAGWSRPPAPARVSQHWGMGALLRSF